MNRYHLAPGGDLAAVARSEVRRLVATTPLEASHFVFDLQTEVQRLREAIRVHRAEVEGRDPCEMIEDSDHKLWSAVALEASEQPDAPAIGEMAARVFEDGIEKIAPKIRAVVVAEIVTASRVNWDAYDGAASNVIDWIEDRFGATAPGQEDRRA